MAEVSWHPQAVLERIKAGAFRGALYGANLVHAEGTRLILAPPKTGRQYRRRGVTHQASAPGEAPASDLGGLAQSGRVIPDQEQVFVRVNWSTRYAAALEYGTLRMAARPYARRALHSQAAEIQSAIADNIAYAVNNG